MYGMLDYIQFSQDHEQILKILALAHYMDVSEEIVANTVYKNFFRKWGGKVFLLFSVILMIWLILIF